MEHSRKQLKELFSLLNALRGMNRKIGLRRHPLIHQSHALFLSLCAGCTNTGTVERQGSTSSAALFASVAWNHQAFFTLFAHTEAKCFFFTATAPLFQRCQELTSSVSVGQEKNGNFITDRSISHSRAGRGEGCGMTRVVSKSLMLMARGVAQ